MSFHERIQEGSREGGGDGLIRCGRLAGTRSPRQIHDVGCDRHDHKLKSARTLKKVGQHRQCSARRRAQHSTRRWLDARSPLAVSDSRRREWSIYGAQRAQPVATGGRWADPENRSNKPIRNRWQPTATVSQRMVKSMFATACHRLPTIPYLLERGSIFGLRKETESREPEGPQDSRRRLTIADRALAA
jgi:hypothetical protein